MAIVRQAQLIPLASFEFIEDRLADQLLVTWGHWLGACNRPFGRQSFGLQLWGIGIISVAVSASTVNKRCGGYDRNKCVELARLASSPAYSWATRICLRLWREIAPTVWPYWPVRACVSYQDAVRHTGNIYRFDGWTRVADVRGGKAGGNWSRGKRYGPKSVWAYEVGP